jgi:hypothetical protein
MVSLFSLLRLAKSYRALSLCAGQKPAQALNCEEEGIAAVFKSLDGVIKELAEDEPKKPVLALPAP